MSIQPHQRTPQVPSQHTSPQKCVFGATLFFLNFFQEIQGFFVGFSGMIRAGRFILAHTLPLIHFNFLTR